jgi:hypothetical protein
MVDRFNIKDIGITFLMFLLNILPLHIYNVMLQIHTLEQTISKTIFKECWFPLFLFYENKISIHSNG